LQGKFADAQQFFRTAMQSEPDDPTANYWLAWSLHQSGALEAGRRQFEAARARAPNWPKLAAQTAWSLATRPEASDRNGPLALQHALMANQAAPAPDPELLDALAAALAEVGRFPEAVAAAKQSLEMSGLEQKAARERRLQAYKRGEPFRDSPNPTGP
jgi:Flp pilus assembly protein TadD